MTGAAQLTHEHAAVKPVLYAPPCTAYDRRVVRAKRAVLAFLLAGCGAAPADVAPQPVSTAVVPEPAPEAPAPVDEAELRRAMLERVLGDIRRYHVFSEVWPRERWEQEVPELEREVREAPDREALLRA